MYCLAALDLYNLTGYASLFEIFSQREEAAVLDVFIVEVATHGRTDVVLPHDRREKVRAERSELLRLEVRLRALRPQPDVATGASNETGLGW